MRRIAKVGEGSFPNSAAVPTSPFEGTKPWMIGGSYQADDRDDRRIKQTFFEMRRYSDRLSVSEPVTQEAVYIYGRAIERNLARHASTTEIMVASLYAACRNMEIPRTLKDFAAACQIKKRDIAKCYRMLLNEIDMKMPVVDPAKCVPKVASRAGMSERAQRRAIEILSKAEEKSLPAGKDPMGLAASALYIACLLEGEQMTQGDAAEAAGVAKATVITRYKTLTSTLGICVSTH